MSWTYRARGTAVKAGPYFRNYAVSLTRGQARGRLTSHGFKFRLPILGWPVTINLTHKRWTVDTPGRGSWSNTWGRAKESTP